MIQKQSDRARIVEIEKELGLLQISDPPYSTLLDSSPLKERIEGADFIILEN
jgi:hypothetical protein